MFLVLSSKHISRKPKPTPRWVLSYSYFPESPSHEHVWDNDELFVLAGDGATKVLRIQDKVMTRRADYHYDRFQVEVQWCMQLRHPNRLRYLNLVPTWPDRSDWALVIYFLCSIVWNKLWNQNLCPPSPSDEEDNLSF